MSLDWARLLHRAVDSLDRAHRARLRRSPRLERAWVGVLDTVVAQQSDRRYFRRAILPAVVGARFSRVLFVGVRGYTKAYGAAFCGTPTEYWTTDIDPDAAAHGEPGRHVTCDVVDLGTAFPKQHFDLVVINGVLGWGCDGETDMNRAIEAARAVLRQGGWLLLGWNSDRIADPRTLASLRAHFTQTGLSSLPHMKTFPDVTHVYAWFRAR